MFNTNLRHRRELQALVPQLLSSRDPIFKGTVCYRPSLPIETSHSPSKDTADTSALNTSERALQTHDLALLPPETAAALSIAVQRKTKQQHPLAAPPKPPRPHLFLLLTPEDLDPVNEAATLERIARFSTLTASPPPTIALILSPDYPAPPTVAQSTAEVAAAAAAAAAAPSPFEAQPGLQAYMRLQTQLHIPQTTTTTTTRITTPNLPPPTIPIPTTHSLLPLLKSYIESSTVAHHFPPLPPPQPTPQPLYLLPYITPNAPHRPLSQHTVNVLSDLCHSLKEVAWICEREEGRRMLREWIGEGEAGEVIAFWEGEGKGKRGERGRDGWRGMK